MELFFLWILCGVACAVIAGSKSRSAFGFFFIGLLLGPIGIIICAFMGKNEVRIENEKLNSGEKKNVQCALN